MTLTDAIYLAAIRQAIDQQKVKQLAQIDLPKAA